MHERELEEVIDQVRRLFPDWIRLLRVTSPVTRPDYMPFPSSRTQTPTHVDVEIRTRHLSTGMSMTLHLEPTSLEFHLTKEDAFCTIIRMVKNLLDHEILEWAHTLAPNVFLPPHRPTHGGLGDLRPFAGYYETLREPLPQGWFKQGEERK